MYDFNKLIGDIVRIHGPTAYEISNGIVYEEYSITWKVPFKNKFKYTLVNDKRKRVVQSYS
jgi:hypothetical protein